MFGQSWRGEFTRIAARSRALTRRLEEERDRQTKDRRARQDRDGDVSDDIDIAGVAFVLATEAQIAAVNRRLDTYDAAVVEALMANEEAQRQVRASIDRMLARAHVLPDGRRVFATADGQQVFDEHGTEVTPGVIDPTAIDPSRPRWEEFRDAVAEERALQDEARELLDYQERLDETRERLRQGDLTTDDLDDLRDRLDADMPEPVRRRLDLPNPSEQPDPTGPESGGTAGSPDLDALRRSLTATGLGAPS